MIAVRGDQDVIGALPALLNKHQQIPHLLIHWWKAELEGSFYAESKCANQGLVKVLMKSYV